MRSLWLLHRSATVTAALLVVAVLAGVGVLLAFRSPSQPSGTAPASRHPVVAPSESGASPAGAPAGASPASRRGGAQDGYTPSYVNPPNTPAQQQFDAELASAQSPTALAAAENLSVPAARYSKAFAAVPAADRSDGLSYAVAFCRELLDVTYRTSSRAALLGWALEESAANTLPGVPASVGWKALYASLADPTLPGAGGGTSPVPSTAGWAADAADGVTQRASGIEASVDQSWNELVSKGFVPRDPLLGLVDVSGTLTVRHGGSTQSSHFSLVLGVGSALHHPGYGAVNVESWQVGG